MAMSTFEMLKQHSIETICTEVGKLQLVNQINLSSHLS